MKEKLIKVIIPVFLSILCGYFCGKSVFLIYSEKDNFAFNENKVYLLEAGEYSSYDNMRANTMSYNYVYYEDNGKYKAIVGITRNKDNLEKILASYGNELVVTEYYLDDSNINSKIDEFDKQLLEENDSLKIKEIILNMLDVYREGETKLLKMS